MQLHNTSKIPSILLELLEHALSRTSNKKHRVPVHTMECQYKFNLGMPWTTYCDKCAEYIEMHACTNTTVW